MAELSREQSERLGDMVHGDLHRRVCSTVAAMLDEARAEGADEAGRSYLRRLKRDLPGIRDRAKRQARAEVGRDAQALFAAVWDDGHGAGTLSQTRGRLRLNPYTNPPRAALPPAAAAGGPLDDPRPCRTCGHTGGPHVAALCRLCGCRRYDPRNADEGATE